MSDASPIFDRESHEYRTAAGVLVPSVTQIIAGAGLCDFSFVEEEVRIRSMERGTSVHWLLQLEDEGALNYRQVPIGLRPYRKAYLGWRRASGFLPELIEKQFISHYGYAGTLDRFGKLPATESFPSGSYALVDFKTGGLQDWIKFQLAAYSMAIHHHPAMAKTIRRIALALHANGTYQVKEFPASTWEHDFSVFIEGKRRIDAGHVDPRRATD